MLSAREDSCFFVILLSYPRTAKVLLALCEFDISPITGWPKASDFCEMCSTLGFFFSVSDSISVLETLLLFCWVLGSTSDHQAWCQDLAFIKVKFLFSVVRSNFMIFCWIQTGDILVEILLLYSFEILCNCMITLF